MELDEVIAHEEIVVSAAEFVKELDARYEGEWWSDDTVHLELALAEFAIRMGAE